MSGARRTVHEITGASFGAILRTVLLDASAEYTTITFGFPIPVI